MMTQKQFKKAGKLFLRRRSNPMIQDMDTLLDVYHDPRTTTNKKMKVLVMIYLLCKTYENNKPDGKRGDSVRELKESAADELNSQRFRYGLTSRAGGSGRKHNLPAVADSAALAPRYQIESVMPQNKTQDNLGLRTRMPAFGMTTVMEKYNNDLSMDDASYKAYQSDNAKSAGHLSFEDWAGAQFDQKSITARLDKLFELWGDDMFNKGKEMQYLSADSRIEYVVAMANGGIFEMVNGQRGNALTCKNRSHMNTGSIYAMDLTERLFVLRGAAMNEGQWNHSSALAGQPVICAGELAANNGQLKFINNSSGHYKPDTESLANCLRVMSQAGVNLSQTVIFDKKTSHYYNNYAAFLAGQVANPDPNLTTLFGGIP